MSFRMIRGAMKTMAVALLMLSIFVVSGGCRTRTVIIDRTNADNRAGSRSKYVDPRSTSPSSTTGIESFDLEGAARSMVGKMRANLPMLGKNVIVDSNYFTVRLHERLDKDLLIDNLRVQLFNAAGGEIGFVSRESAAMWEEEQDLRAEGVVEGPAGGGEPKQMRIDYRLRGRITNHRTNDGRVMDNYVQMVFEMVDVNTTQLVFTDRYTFKKQLFLDIAYR